MPLYSFKCRNCNYIQDKFFNLQEEKRLNCENCRSTNIFQYFGDINVSVHGFTEFNDPRYQNKTLTMKQIKEIEKKQNLVYAGHDEIKKEAEKNKIYNEKKITSKINNEITKETKKLYKKWNA